MTFYNEDKRRWKDLTDEEKGALLLAHHEGKEIQYLSVEDIWAKKKRYQFHPIDIYRVKPEPKREAVVLDWVIHHVASTASMDTHQITFDVIDGEPDCSSIKMEKL